MNNSELSHNILIRDYLEKDYDEIVKLWTLTDMGSPVRADSKETVKRTLKYGGKLLVMQASSEGKIIGSAWMTYDGRRIMLHHFGILPEFQGKGLSKLLMKNSLEYVKENGSQVKLEVHSSNLKAINLYTKFGFTRLGDYNIYIIRDVSNL
jgi:[ribosomal protein S18]-alanine N-acetyltransferase